MATDQERRDALTLLSQILAPCEGADEHSWRKCKRCAAIHGVEMRFSLSMRLLEIAAECVANDVTGSGKRGVRLAAPRAGSEKE